MSFPEIPNVTWEQALTHILESIALQETALADFINGETKKMQTIISQISNLETSSLAGNQDMITFQKHVDNTIQTVIKMQMLLQFKLKTILDAKQALAPPPPPTALLHTYQPLSAPRPPSTSDTEELLPFSPVATEPPPSTSQLPILATEYNCSLTGSGQGRITNPSDFFFYGSASIPSLMVCIRHGVIESSAFTYQIIKKGVTARIKVLPKTLKAQCTSPFITAPTPEDPNIAVITGKGIIEKHTSSQKTLNDNCSFILTVWDGGSGSPGTDKFRMIIVAENSPRVFNHDSGIVSVIGNLVVETLPVSR
ncbi:MAG TPA: hypothetical protein VGL27_00680 [Negativicutes bacterium]